MPEHGYEFLILTPCGICQERLATWGFDLEVAVATERAPYWAARKLSEVTAS